jgi:hypothetical protein
MLRVRSGERGGYRSQSSSIHPAIREHGSQLLPHYYF